MNELVGRMQSLNLSTWFGEIYSCCCQTSLPRSAWVLLDFNLQTLILDLVRRGRDRDCCYDDGFRKRKTPNLALFL